ncbi:chloramphenicol phosphotransferase CPT family protein [Taklimakanibacter deserti]|uniref:chloramphenicol phosphotransferase CPT family protein n=1 Tax=Taklimakanibacter deserti TaxID=2267839 RepID=UPI000E65E8B0
MTSRIIILNGVGSAGKSTIAHALQDVTAEPYLHVAMDAFLDMLPSSYENHPDGFTFETIAQNGEPMVAIKSGKVVQRALRGMRRAIAALAAEGNNLIVDDVMLGAEMEEYKSLLAGFHVSFVGVFAPLAILEERERQRQDRLIGLARWQYDRVHAGKTYDLEIDTSTATPEACALRIKEAFGL